MLSLQGVPNCPAVPEVSLLGCRCEPAYIRIRPQPQSGGDGLAGDLRGRIGQGLRMNLPADLTG